MRPVLFLFLYLLVKLPAFAQKQSALGLHAAQSNAAGEVIALIAGEPGNLSVSGNRKYLMFSEAGTHANTLQLIDPQKRTLLYTATLPALCTELKFAADDKTIYAGFNSNGQIKKYWITHDTLLLLDSIQLGNGADVRFSCFAIDDRKNRLYVLEQNASILYIVNLSDKKVLNKISLSALPHSCVWSAVAGKLYITLQGSNKVIAYDSRKETVTDSVTIGNMPGYMCLSKDEKYLFIANVLDNSVSVVDAGSFIETEILVRQTSDTLTKHTAGNIVISDEKHQIFVSNPDDDFVDVYDITQFAKGIHKGYIPVGYKARGLVVLGGELLVLCGGNTDYVLQQGGSGVVADSGEVQQPKVEIAGSLSVIELPDDKQLKGMTGQVRKSMVRRRALKKKS